MTWATMPTFADGNALTAAQLNILVANILESAAAKATTAGYHFVSTGTNQIAERPIVAGKVTTQQTTTSATYANLTTVGPTVTATTGTQALVHIGSQMFNSSTGTCWSTYEISGATTLAATTAGDERAITCEAAANNSFRFGYTELQALTAGSNTFTQKYRVGSATGTFDDRHLIVMAL